MVQVGTAGHKNLDTHRASKACHTRAKVNGWQRVSKPDQVLESFFTPRTPLSPSRVSAPAPVHATEAIIVQAPELVHPIANALQGSSMTTLMTTAIQPSSDTNMKICQRGLQLLRGLEVATNRIPSDIPSATPEDLLSVFVIDPCHCVAEPGEDDWPILNTMLKSSFGWEEVEMAAAIPQMLKHGEYGLDGFIKFMMYFVVNRGLQGVMFETKVKALIRELDDW